MQPTYLPWLGYFDLIDRSDCFVFLDDVKVGLQTWGVRNRIRTQQGERYLTVPIRHDRPRSDILFTNAQIDYGKDWAGTHLKSIAQAYSKSPHFDEVFPAFEALLTPRYATLGDLNRTVIETLAAKMGIRARFERSSQLPAGPGAKDDRLVSICRLLGAGSYISPQGSAAYIEAARPGGAFASGTVELYYHHFVHPEYRQRGPGFISHMSVVDLLMNCGYEDALQIVRSGRRTMIPGAEFRRAQDSGRLNGTGGDLSCA
jgi:hypothetical protein